MAVFAGDDPRSLLLNGHVDVVPVGDRAKWTVDPFGGDVSDKRIWGRGANDMKSGFAASLAAIRAIQKAGYRPEGRTEFHAVVDEEAGGSGRSPRRSVARWPKGESSPSLPGARCLRRKVVLDGRGWSSPARIRIPLGGTTQSIRSRTSRAASSPVDAVDYAARFIEQLRELERDWARTKSHPLLPPGVNSLHVARL